MPYFRFRLRAPDRKVNVRVGSGSLRGDVAENIRWGTAFNWETADMERETFWLGLIIIAVGVTLIACILLAQHLF